MYIQDRMYDLFAWKLHSNVKQLNGGCSGGGSAVGPVGCRRSYGGKISLLALDAAVTWR